MINGAVIFNVTLPPKNGAVFGESVDGRHISQ